MYSIVVFGPWFCCFMILLWCIFLCHGYVIIVVHSFLGGYLLMLTTRVICHFFGNGLTHLGSILRLFPNLVLHSFGYMLILVVGTLFLTQAFIFWMLLCCLVFGRIVFLVGVENYTSPSCCGCHCHLCASIHIINFSHRHHQYCYMN